MFYRYLLALIATFIAFVSADFQLSAHNLCVTGCCGFELKFEVAELAISSDSSLSIPVSRASIPCCDCLVNGSPNVAPNVTQPGVTIQPLPQEPSISMQQPAINDPIVNFKGMQKPLKADDSKAESDKAESDMDEKEHSIPIRVKDGQPCVEGDCCDQQMQVNINAVSSAIGRRIGCCSEVWCN